MTVFYDYEAQDDDEVSLKEGDIVDLIKEGVLHFKKLLTRVICSLKMKAAGGQ